MRHGVLPVAEAGGANLLKHDPVSQQQHARVAQGGEHAQAGRLASAGQGSGDEHGQVGCVLEQWLVCMLHLQTIPCQCFNGRPE